MAHAVESHVCTKANPFSRMCSLAAWRHLSPHFEAVLREPNNLSARAEMQIGAHFAGMAIEAAMAGRSAPELKTTWCQDWKSVATA